MKSVHQRARRRALRAIRSARVRIAATSPQVKAAVITVAVPVLRELIGKL